MRIVISSDPCLLHILRGVVRFCAGEAGFPESDAESLAMAINEAAANVIRHTYKDCPNKKLALEILSFPDRMDFVLQDWGPKVNHQQVRPRPLDEVRPGGLGTFFIRTFVDGWKYEDDCAEGNRLRMVKNIPRKVSTHDES